MLKKQAVPSGAAFFLLYLAILNFLAQPPLTIPAAALPCRRQRYQGFTSCCVWKSEFDPLFEP